MAVEPLTEVRSTEQGEPLTELHPAEHDDPKRTPLRRVGRREQRGQADLSPAPKETSSLAPKPPRLLSLDAFRGLTILGMLLVNNVALDTATPRPLTHAPWNGGIHFADLVFPWFVLIVGVAIPFAAAAHRAKGLSHWRYDLKVLSRSVTLVLLGCLLDFSHYKQPLFLLGVLQLIGLAYLMGALLYDLPVGRRLGVAGGLLVAHWAAIRFLPIPGAHTGVFTEQTNLISHIDQVYLQPVALRGLFSVAPLTALVLIGSAMGDVLRHGSRSALRRTAWLLVAGPVLMLAGWLWSHDLPFNKTVWTAPFILYAAGSGALVLGLFHGLIDGLRVRFLAFPLIVFGSNALLAYVAPILVKIDILDTWHWHTRHGDVIPLQQAIMEFCYTHAGRIRGGWIYTLGYIFLWWLVLLVMYRKRIFWRV